MQRLWDNQLGDVYSVGLGSSGCVGAAIAAVMGTDMGLGAMIACIISTLIVVLISTRLSVKKFIVFCMVFGSTVGSIGVIAANNASPEQLHLYYQWTSVSLKELSVTVYTVVVSLFTLLIGATLLFSKNRILAFTGVCLTTTAIISVIGIIGMVSLVVPNIAVILTTNKRYQEFISVGLAFILLMITYTIVNFIDFIYLPASATLAIIMTPLLLVTFLKK